jgi:DNA-binding IclR family transcriptional regulator
VATAVGPRAQLLTRDAAARTAAQTLPRVMPVRVLDRIRLIGRALEDEPGLTAPELAERVGFPRRHMSLVLLRLEEHGHVVHDGRRWFPGRRCSDHPLKASVHLRRSARDPAKSRILR